jgi:spore germination protein YaaH
MNHVARIVIVAWLVGPITVAMADEDLQPVSVHRLAWEANRYARTSPDLVGDLREAIIPLQPRTRQSRPCATIFGYLPYWESSTYLRYDLLTHIACFSIEVNSDGSLGNSHLWPWTSLINTAHQNGVKIVLVATLFDGAKIQTLITNATYKNNFFVNIKNKMLQGSADGLNIDFEDGTGWQSSINAFMADLTAYIHAEIPSSEVTIAGPAVNWSGWNLPALAASCDGIFIMGYAFWGSWSSTSGPNAPLTGGSVNITNTVVTQYAGAAPEKLILGVPYYGNHWTTTSSAPRSAKISFIGSTLFTNDEPNSQNYGLQWETSSQTPWYRWNDGTNWHQVWFDNAESLGLKYDLAQSHNLQGVGMWALGYDGSRAELWDELQAQYGGCYYYFDFDNDRDVDQTDFSRFAFCLMGPAYSFPSGNSCLTADADGDGNVDLRDFAAFQAAFTGP